MMKLKPTIGAGLLAALMTVGFLGGCVDRKINIVSDPPGALVLLNDVEVGRTPVAVPFTWYGDYDVRLRLERNVGTPEKPVVKKYYLHTHRQTQMPWWEFFGVDLVSELSPGEFKDNQVWAFAIPEVVEPSEDELLERAREMKGRLGEGSALQGEKK